MSDQKRERHFSEMVEKAKRQIHRAQDFERDHTLVWAYEEITRLRAQLAEAQEWQPIEREAVGRRGESLLASQVLRAFWRRVQPYVYGWQEYPQELPEDVPIELVSAMETALLLVALPQPPKEGE